MKSNSYDSPGKVGGNLESVGRKVSILEPEETPFFSSISKKSASATFSEVVADTLRKPRINGTREGKGRTGIGNKAASRKRFGTYQHRLFDEYAVTDVQQNVSERGGVATNSDEAGTAYAKCMREIKRDAEGICMSDQEGQGGSDEEMRTRGVFCWLDATKQTNNNVPADFMPPQGAPGTPAGSVYSVVSRGTNRKLVEADYGGVGYGTDVAGSVVSFNSILKSIKQQYGRKVNLQCHAGDNIIETVDTFTRASGSIDSNNVVRGDGRYKVEEMGNNHTITLMCSIFESSFARVTMIPNQFLLWNATTETSNPNVCAFINREFWEVQWLEELVNRELDDRDGDGPSGWIRGKFGLLCSNPKGQGAIIP